MDITHKYNKKLVERCHELGGKWTGTSWQFDSLVDAEVAKLNDLYNGYMIAIELTAKRDLIECRESIYFAGYPIARAFGRDSGAKTSEGIMKLEGTITSGGSRANWDTIIKKGTILRMRISRDLLETLDEGDRLNWNIELLDENKELKEIV